MIDIDMLAGMVVPTEVHDDSMCHIARYDAIEDMHVAYVDVVELRLDLTTKED